MAEVGVNGTQMLTAWKLLVDKMAHVCPKITVRFLDTSQMKEHNVADAKDWKYTMRDGVCGRNFGRGELFTSVIRILREKEQENSNHVTV